MAAQEMYDYLEIAIPDYSTTTFSVSPQDVLPERGGYNQEIIPSDDYKTEKVITHSTESRWDVSLAWNALTAADAGTIRDFYFDKAKAYGVAQSFKWAHPTDEHTYVVKFREDLTTQIKEAHIHAPLSIKLKVVGRIAD